MTKIRLIRNDGGVLTLDSTGYSMNITRSLPVIPVPLLGERYGVDLNMVSADFKIDVILADDDCSAATFQESAASATIDFSATRNTESGDYSAYMSGGGTVSAADLNGKFFELHSAFTGESVERPPVRITFDSSTASHTATNTPSTVTVGIQGITTDDALASAVKTACEAASFTQQLTTGGGSGNSFSSAFTITVSNGEKTNNAKLTFTQTEAGAKGNTETPTFDKTFNAIIPLFESFAGGTDQSCKSAGDKLQDLIGFIGNASLLGESGSVFKNRADPKGLLETDISFSTTQTADYIIGLQLPYNSIVTSSSANNDYVERNFVIITGRTDAIQQGSEANTLSVSTVFEDSDPYTGIHGTVTAMSFNFRAGENIYEGSLTFYPIDFIVGA